VSPPAFLFVSNRKVRRVSVQVVQIRRCRNPWGSGTGCITCGRPDHITAKFRWVGTGRVITLPLGLMMWR
jgi:hypothetical protein